MYLSNNIFGSQIGIYVRYQYHPKITVFGHQLSFRDSGY